MAWTRVARWRTGSPLLGGGTIPALLSIDVEPDAFQPPRGDPGGWGGYERMVEFAGWLRERLAERAGARPRFGWYFRSDPQIAEVYGRPDHGLAAFPARVAALRAQRDYFGVHAHPLRWSAPRGLWVHDFGDAEWVAHCARFALDAHARWAGESPRRFRAGAGFLSDGIVEVLEQAGVAVDLSLEPVAGWGLTASDVETGVDRSPIVGPYTDCRTAPRVPYRPAHHDFRVPGGRRGRRLVMIPLSSTVPRAAEPARRWFAWRPAGRERVQMLYPAVPWPSERGYWDLVERQLRSMRQPYLSLAIRTDAVDSTPGRQVRRLFEALPEHPVAARLRFVDPLDVASRLAA